MFRKFLNTDYIPLWVNFINFSEALYFPISVVKIAVQKFWPVPLALVHRFVVRGLFDRLNNPAFCLFRSSENGQVSLDFAVFLHFIDIDPKLLR